MREMKDSGIEWIGKIPQNWILKKGKFLFKQRNTRGNATNLELLSPAQHYGVISQGEYEKITGMKAVKLKEKTDLSQLKTIHNGDYCISLRSFQGGFEFCANEGVVSPAYQVFYAQVSTKPSYYKYLFKSDAFISKMNSFTMSLRDGKNIAFSDFGNTLIPYPPLLSQQAIADFLDAKCADIDSLTADIQKQIDILKEYKKSVITQAVTKGLEPNVEMKDSGIAWIGKIPKHWNVSKLKYLGRLQNGISKSHDFFGRGNPFITYGDVYNNDKLPLQGSGLIMSTLQEQRLYSIKQGDVFFTRTSETIEEIGFASTCIQNVDNATFAGFLIRFRPINECLLPEFSRYYFRSEIHRHFFVKEMNLVTRASLGQILLGKLPVLLPTIDEQHLIVDFLDAKCDDIDTAIAGKQKQLDVLKEYKKSLIYEYVTGKKEVPCRE